MSKRARKKWLAEHGYLNFLDTPRYTKAWRDISQYFDFPLIIHEINGKKNIRTNHMPTAYGKSVSLSYLLQIMRHEISNNLDPILNLQDIDIAEKFKSLHFKSIPHYHFKDFKKIANYLQSGDPINFIIPLCPDWPYDPITKIYTFKEKLKDSIGLVAQKALESIPLILKHFPLQVKNIRFCIIVAVADRCFTCLWQGLR